MHLSKKKKRARNIIAMDRRQKIVTLLFRNPAITNAEIAELVGVTPNTVAQDIRIIKDEFKAERVSKIETHLYRQVLEIEKLKRECWDRLSGCKAATTGSRWAEMILRALHQQAQLLGLNDAGKRMGRAEEAAEGNVTPRLKDEQESAAVNAVVAAFNNAIPVDGPLPGTEDIVLKKNDETNTYH
jgi:DNA-binding CsgD family transcriptional regulator